MKAKTVNDGMLRAHAWCYAHNRYCIIPWTDLSGDGTPCTDYSPVGAMKGLHGPTNTAHLCNSKIHRVRHTSALFPV
eukprot:5971720-Karenia_brevis.AAC.1